MPVTKTPSYKNTNAMATLLKILVAMFFLSTSILILGDEDVPPPLEDPCTDCKRCKDCEEHCLDYNCTNCEEETTLTRSCAIAVLVGGGIGVPVALSVLGFFGFATGGVGAGSIAAIWQSTMGGIVIKGSFFSLLQSVTAGGFSYAGYVVVSGSVGATLGTFCKKLGIDISSQINCG